MAGEEDEDGFSFPTTTCTPPRFIGSPRLWRSSSYSDNGHQIKLTKSQHEEECELTTEDRKRINLLSYIERKGGDGSHENMDVIWEDLNYEDEMPEKVKKYGEGVVACGGGKRPSMAVVINVLKKLLLLQHTSRHWAVKKRVADDRSERRRRTD